MTVINNLPISLAGPNANNASPAKNTNAIPKASSAIDTDGGAPDAVKVTLSPAAQRIAAANTTTAPRVALIDPVASAVASSKRKVQAEVGVVGATEVVDKKGFINSRKLAELIALQK